MVGFSEAEKWPSSSTFRVFTSGCLSFWGVTVDAFWRMDDMDDGEHGILGSVLFVMFIYFPTICSFEKDASLMEEIPNNQPWTSWDKLPTSTGERRISDPSTV